MWISGWGWRTATSLSRSSSIFSSATSWLFQNTSPSLLTAMTMFSGLVCVGRFLSLGSSTGTLWMTTGIVMRKMISNTSITSTSGVVLMSATRSSSASGLATVMLMIRSPRVCDRRGRAHGREEREAALQAVADDVDRPLQGHADPGIEIELLGLHGAVVLGRERALLGNEPERAVLVERGDTLLHGVLVPEFLVGFLGILQHSSLLEHLDDADVPGADRHDHEYDQRAPRDEVPLAPERFDAVGVLDGFGCRRRGGGRRWLDLGRRRFDLDCSGRSGLRFGSLR